VGLVKLSCSLIGLPLAGETDWKVIAVDVTDPLANHLNGML